MNKISFAAVLAALLTAGAAHAATLDITLGPTITYSYNASQSLPASNVIISNHTPGLDLVNNDRIIPEGDNKTDYWASPGGLALGSDYLAVLGLNHNLNQEDEGIAVFTLAKGDDHLGFTWGTIDAYNTLTLVAGGKQYVITGTDILDSLSAIGPTAGTTQVNVEITDPFGDIKKAIFTSTSNSFELGNITEMDTPAATPLPPALLLFGTGLAALYMFGRRRIAKA